MPKFIVSWEEPIEAGSEREAAQIALRLQREPLSQKVDFLVREVETNDEILVTLLWDEENEEDYDS